jgi:hypothetical protein
MRGHHHTTPIRLTGTNIGKYRVSFTTPDHLAQLYTNPTIFHRQICNRVEKKYGVLGGNKIPVIVDEVDAGDVVEELVRCFVKTGSSLLTKPPKPVSSVSALPSREGIESFSYTRRG